MSRLVFTNGCFDILHPGHVDLLARARALGDKLVVGINSDDSVRRIKGPERPFMDQEARKAVLLGLSAVDEVIIFDELTPQSLIEELKPDVLVKGGDWNVNQIVGADFVLERGGEVRSLPLLGEHSSSRILKKRLAGQDEAEQARDTKLRKDLEDLAEMFRSFPGSTFTAIEDTLGLLRTTLRAGKNITFYFGAMFRSEKDLLRSQVETALPDANYYEGDTLERYVSPGDCLLIFDLGHEDDSTAGQIMSARKTGASVATFTALDGRKLASLSDAAIMVPSRRRDHVLDAHFSILRAVLRALNETSGSVSADPVADTNS